MRELRVAASVDDRISRDGCHGDDLRTARALMELSTEEVGQIVNRFIHCAGRDLP
jgi:hypothetical protein